MEPERFPEVSVEKFGSAAAGVIGNGQFDPFIIDSGPESRLSQPGVSENGGFVIPLTQVDRSNLK